MAKVKGRIESRSHWFRQFFRADRTNLKKDASEIRTAWEEAHPGTEWTELLSGTLANVRSYEKKHSPKGKRRGRPPQENGEDKSEQPTRVLRSAGQLENLELAIDRCLSVARSMEEKDSALENVVKHLRFARNGVILIRGRE
jgi:hypothetical protein